MDTFKKFKSFFKRARKATTEQLDKMNHDLEEQMDYINSLETDKKRFEAQAEKYMNMATEYRNKAKSYVTTNQTFAKQYLQKFKQAEKLATDASNRSNFLDSMIIKIQKAYDNRTIYAQLTRGVTLLKEVNPKNLMEMFDQFQTISDDIEDIESNFSTLTKEEMGDVDDLDVEAELQALKAEIDKENAGKVLGAPMPSAPIGLPGVPSALPEAPAETVNSDLAALQAELGL